MRPGRLRPAQTALGQLQAFATPGVQRLMLEQLLFVWRASRPTGSGSATAAAVLAMTARTESLASTAKVNCILEGEGEAM